MPPRKLTPGYKSSSPKTVDFASGLDPSATDVDFLDVLLWQGDPQTPFGLGKGGVVFLGW